MAARTISPTSLTARSKIDGIVCPALTLPAALTRGSPTLEPGGGGDAQEPVAAGLGVGAGGGELGAQEGVEEGGLADVGPAQDGDEARVDGGGEGV